MIWSFFRDIRNPFFRSEVTPTMITGRGFSEENAKSSTHESNGSSAVHIQAEWGHRMSKEHGWRAWWNSGRLGEDGARK